MNNAKILTLSMVFLVTAAGCTQTRVQPPPTQQSYDYKDQSQISEQGIDPSTEGEYLPVKTTPQPIQQPVIEPLTGQSIPVSAVVLPSIDYVNDRIFEYGRKLERWKELDQQSVVMTLNEEQTESMVRCFRDLQKVLNGYDRLYDDLLQRNVISEAELFRTEDVLELQKMDIAFLDSVCGRMLSTTEDKAAGWQQREEGADLNQVETLIERYSSSKEHDEVVQVWLKIPQYQVERVDLKTKILYGNALIYLDQQEKAAEIYQQIVDEMSVSREQPTDVLSLRKTLADLYTASGDYFAAEGQYEQISTDYSNIGRIEEWSKLQLSILERSTKGSPELTEFSRLMRDYLSFQPEKDGYKVIWQADEYLQSYPYSPVSSNVDVIKEDALRRADEWFEAFFIQVDQYTGENKFQDAMDLLQNIPEDIIGADKIQLVKTRIDELVLGEAVERETLKIERMQDLQRRWNEGMLLADQNDYDGAIVIFTELLDTSYQGKAQVKIEELSLQAAKADRRKAAELFIRFTKTTDIEGKKRLLIESRRILKEILVKYPEVDIAKKVVGNIDRVENEMNQLDPMLLPSIEMEEREKAAQQNTLRPQSLPGTMDAFDLPTATDEVKATSPYSSTLPVVRPEDLQ